MHATIHLSSRIALRALSRGSIFAAAVLVAFTAASARPLDDALASFGDAVTKESRSLFGGRGDGRQALSVLKQLEKAVAGEQWNEALELLQRIKYETPAAGILKHAGPLAAELRAAENAAELASLRKVDDAVAQAGAACLSAREPADLDRAIAALAEATAHWQRGVEKPSQAMLLARVKAGAAQTYLKTWQEYLTLRKNGDEQAAAQKMASLLNGHAFYPVVPRSEVLARSTPPPNPPNVFRADDKIRELFSATTSLEDLEALTDSFTNWTAEQPQSSELRAAAVEARRLHEAHLAIGVGDYGRALQLTLRTPHDASVPPELISPLRLQLLRLLLPRYLGSVEVEPPAGDENPADYLARICDAAVAKRDWKLALRSLETLRVVAYGGSGDTPAWLRADLACVAALDVAERLRSAGRLAQAAEAYLGALEIPGGSLPVELIAEQIRTMERQHPGTMRDARSRAARLQKQSVSRGKGGR